MTLTFSDAQATSPLSFNQFEITDRFSHFFYSQSESDRKIDDIMDQILSRSGSAVSAPPVLEEGPEIASIPEVPPEADRKEGAPAEATMVVETKPAAEKGEESGTKEAGGQELPGLGPKSTAAESTLAELTKGVRLSELLT